MKKKQEAIRRYILRKIAVDDQEVIFKAVDNFDIDQEIVNAFLQEGICEGGVEESKECKCGYKLVEHVSKSDIKLNEKSESEDRIFDNLLCLI